MAGVTNFSESSKEVRYLICPCFSVCKDTEIIELRSFVFSNIGK